MSTSTTAEKVAAQRYAFTRGVMSREEAEHLITPDELERLLMTAQTPCPHVRTDRDGTSHCALAEGDGQELARLRAKLATAEERLDREAVISCSRLESFQVTQARAERAEATCLSLATDLHTTSCKLAAVTAERDALQKRLDIETAMPTHLLDVHAICDQRDKAVQARNALQKQVRTLREACQAVEDHPDELYRFGDGAGYKIRKALAATAPESTQGRGATAILVTLTAK